jgi:hypothetical protein
MKYRKHIIAIDFIVVVGTLGIIALLVGYGQPLVIAPLDDLTTSDGSVLFVFEKANLILIDDNNRFTSPLIIEAEDNLVINLKPGVYYWKVEGALSSDVRSLTIQSEVDLKLREKEEEYEVVNSGNTRLNVNIYEDGALTGNVILDVDEEEEVSGTKFVGGQDE